MSIYIGKYTAQGSALMYKGTWDANTNTPVLGDGGTGGVVNEFYVVSVPGAFTLDGITPWIVGDWVLNDGSVWQKVPYTARRSNDERVVSLR